MNIFSSVRKIPHFLLISHLAKKHNIGIWLVGGFLRDICLNLDKELVDFDFCVEKRTFFIVKKISEKISSKFIVLDKKQQSFRIILKRRNKQYTYDFTLMRGDDLLSDLSLRDFSINTLAVDLRSRGLELIDYYGALNDLKHKKIRVVRDEVIAEDPLRILRGFAFAANYGFIIQYPTIRLMVKFKKLLKNVSPERVNEELFKIFNSPRSFKIIRLMDELRVIDEIIPDIVKARGVSQGKYHHLDVWAHSLETLRQFELLYSRKLAENREICLYLNEELAQDRRRIQIIKLASILHDIGKPLVKKKKKKKTIFHTHEKAGCEIADKIALRLRLSLREKDVLKKLIFWHLRPGYLADQIIPSRRAIYHFFRDTQKEGIGVLILSLSDWRATRGPLTDACKRRRHERVMFKLMDSYFLERKKKPLKKIIDGHDLMRKFKLPSGPLIGEILERIKEEQTLGKISNKTEAYKTAVKIISKSKSANRTRKKN